MKLFVGGAIRAALVALMAASVCTGARAEWVRPEADAVHARERSMAKDPKQTDWEQTGVASYYGRAHNGRRTASGERFDQEEMTAAHPSLPFGTRLKVMAVSTGREVVVTITDRLPSRRRVIDLSLAAARSLGIVRQGTANVMLSRL
jgi:rare lipoprotein A